MSENSMPGLDQLVQAVLAAAAQRIAERALAGSEADIAEAIRPALRAAVTEKAIKDASDGWSTRNIVESQVRQLIFDELGDGVREHVISLIEKWKAEVIPKILHAEIEKISRDAAASAMRGVR